MTKKPGRNSKYTPEIVETILTTLRLTGSDRASYESGGISAETFYNWINNRPEFSEGVACARRDFREGCPEAIRAQATKAYQDYLYERHEEVWTKEESGEVDGKPFNKTTVTRIKRGVPLWAIERALGKNSDILNLVKELAQIGSLPHESAQSIAKAMEQFRDVVRDAINSPASKSLSMEQDDGSNN